MDHNYSTINTPNRERGKHLKFEDRVTIKVCRKLGLALRPIAELLSCSPSTVSYELRRGTGERNGSVGRKPEYSAKRGQKTYEQNRSLCHKESKVCADNPFILWIIDCIRTKKWSLDACVGYAKKHKLFADDLWFAAKHFITLFGKV